MAAPPVPAQIPSQTPLAPCVASVTLVADVKGDNEMIQGLYTDLLKFALELRKTPENLSQESRRRLRDHVKWDHLPPNEAGMIAQYVRKGEGRKEEKDVVGYLLI